MPDVDALFARIRADHGRLDLLVNNVWGGYENSECKPLAFVPFWQQPLHQWDGHVHRGRARASHGCAAGRPAHAAAAARRDREHHRQPGCAAVPCRTSSTISRSTPLPGWPGRWRRSSRSTGIASLAVAPGFMRTERVTEAFRSAGALAAPGRSWRPEGNAPPYLGRAIVALASDPQGAGQVRTAAGSGHARPGNTASPMRTARSPRPSGCRTNRALQRRYRRQDDSSRGVGDGAVHRRIR